MTQAGTALATKTFLFPLAGAFPLASPWMNKLLDFIISITILSAVIEIFLMVVVAFSVMALGLLGIVVRKEPFKTATSLIHAIDREWARREMNKAHLDSLQCISDPQQLAFLLQEHGLTSRQIEVALLAVENATYKEIGEILGIEEGTVKEHMKRLLKHLGLKNKRELIHFARKLSSR